MYNLLIVDDEKIAVDTLYEILQDFMELDLSIYRAYSGTDALHWLEKTRIDIVVTDVCMPDIDGMELQETIINRWPGCKVIFLSGYDDFEYARAALRNNGVDYIIKTDRNEVIFNAIKKAVAQIRQKELNEQLLADARREFKESIPVLQKEYIMELLGGGEYGAGEMRERFSELGICLDPESPVLLLLGHSENRESKNYALRKLELYTILRISEDYLKDFFLLGAAADSNNQPIWLLQPCSTEPEQPYLWDRAAVTLQHMLDAVQNSCSELAGIRISFAFSSKPCAWQKISGKYDELIAFFYGMAFGSGKEMILSDALFTMNDGEKEEYSLTLYSMRELLKLVPKLEYSLEYNEQVEFESVFSKITSEINRIRGVFPGMGVELYYSIALMFQRHINKLGIYHDIARAVEIGKLMRMDLHGSWKEIAAYFLDLAAVIYQLRSKDIAKRTRRIVLEIQKYIKGNLEKDLSAVVLADLVNLNQSYLSRLFRQETGVSLSDYITEAKLDRARELLERKNLKINEVASLLGFSTHNSFSRFFRRYTGMSPQDYKEE